MAEARHSNRNCATVKLLITSSDCNPESELPFPVGHPPLTVSWNDVVDALTRAKYCFSMRRLPPPPQNPIAAPETLRSEIPDQKVAFLSLLAAKKAAFFHGDGDCAARYQICYDASLMNDLPSHLDLIGFPQFHLFESLPEELQCAIAERLDGAGFARMRCVSRRLRRSLSFNIPKYSHPDRLGNWKSNSDERWECYEDNRLFRLDSTVCLVVVVVCFVAKCAYEYVNEDDEK